MTKRFLKISALVGAAAVALLLVAGVQTSGTARAEWSTLTPGPSPTPVATPDPLAQQTVNTNAVISGVGVAPVIECKWELPDMQSGFTDGTFPDGRIQYQLNATPTGAHVHDDDMSPSAGPSLSPACTLPAGVGAPSMPGHMIPAGTPGAGTPSASAVHKMIQVVPNPQNTPEPRRIQLWMAVDNPNGISAIADVFWKIYHPNGTLKVQVHGTPVPVLGCDPDSTGSLGDAAAVGKMFEAAVDTGQLSAAAVNDPARGMVVKCLESEKRIYYNYFDLHKEQACGEYRIDATAVGATGATDTLTNYIDVECVFYLKIDFNTVNWAGIAPGYADVVSGDLVWDVPPDNAPTVRNVGNTGMGLAVLFTPMVGQQNFDKEITTFDACFGKDALHLQCIGRDPDPPAPPQPWNYIPAGAVTPFDNDPNRVLCSDQDGKLDLSIHPPYGLPADTYLGTLTVIGRLVPDVCEVDQE